MLFINNYIVSGTRLVIRSNRGSIVIVRVKYEHTILYFSYKRKKKRDNAHSQNNRTNEANGTRTEAS